MTPVPGSPLVVLDPGHNGGNSTHIAQIERQVPDGRGGTKPCNSTGTATDAGYPEHTFNFDVAQRTQRLLEAAGVRVLLTRPDDNGVGPCVDVRGTAGQRAGAAAVVSIHADGAAASGSGFHVALSNPPLNPAQAGQAHVLGTALRDALRAAGFHDSTYLGSQGISLRADLAGLNFATKPTALVECANMRNAGGSGGRLVGGGQAALRGGTRERDIGVPTGVNAMGIELAGGSGLCSRVTLLRLNRRSVTLLRCARAQAPQR